MNIPNMRKELGVGIIIPFQHTKLNLKEGKEDREWAMMNSFALIFFTYSLALPRQSPHLLISPSDEN